MRSRRAKEDITLNKRDKRHGTYTGYNYYGCSCERCRKANSDYINERKAIWRASVPDHVHGSFNGYNNYGCRCDECMEAQRENSRLRRGRERTKARGKDGPRQRILWVDEVPSMYTSVPSKLQTRGRRPAISSVVEKPVKPEKFVKPVKAAKPVKAQPAPKAKRRKPVDDIPEEMRAYWISPWAEHGTVTGYRYWACRCDLCREASSQYQRKTRSG